MSTIDTGRTTLDVIRQRYVAVNGDHPMSAEDDDYVRACFVPLDAVDLPEDEVHRLILDGRLPLPSYLLSDGSPMVHPGYLDNLRAAGGPEQVEGWFRGHWPDAEDDGCRGVGVPPLRAVRLPPRGHAGDDPGEDAPDRGDPGRGDAP